ncbi:MAG TPA: primosomal protein N' [Porphyromonadaceae bacterium]|jgi:primosomal protein N' (replication factor Y)|nr:primosomal protein N' [Porphyromonadaceae bacterium]HCM20401.1 primosomal protein N' [Porphyromonadaceae bacterium]
MFADVVLPLPLSETFTYAVPASMQSALAIGCRVIVPFGKRKYYTAIVLKIHHDAPQRGVSLKDIHSLIDSVPLVNENQLKLWEWVSFYYLSPLGDVYKAAFPSKLRMESETMVSALVGHATDEKGLRPKEKQIIDLLNEHDLPVKISEIAVRLKIVNVLPTVYSLAEKGLVVIHESIQSKFAPKTETHIFLPKKLSPQSASHAIGKAKKQQLLYEQITGLFAASEADSFSRKEIMALTGASASVLNGLLQKNVLRQATVEIGRLGDGAARVTRAPHTLNEYQQQAFTEIIDCFNDRKPCLLHGVTSSGKTEIYIHLIKRLLDEGKQTLYLVPEIALTTQLTHRLQAVFGDKLAIYHSKINDQERAEIWKKMLSDHPYDIVIGVRSSLFLPFKRLGLIIVDEEHESSYKQTEPAPRYHARDTAVMLAHLTKAPILLGTATPSMESYFNAKTGKYGLVTLANRYEDISLPEIILENTKELRRKKKMKSLLSPALISYMDNALQEGGQVILFRNRRGFAPMVECQLCGWTPKCRRCDVSLTYHKSRNELVCHYCGTTYKMVTECPECHQPSIEPVGMGTEQVEEEVARLFPEVSIARMDADTTRGKNAYENILSAFQQKKTRILIGTQMLSKGLDFDDVSVVGIISADSLLNYPDFRSHERGFQLMMQASGRAGRKNKRGKVIIQSNDPEQPLYRYLTDNDYEGFFRQQAEERKLFNYPPYSRLIRIVIKNKDEQKAEVEARAFAGLLRPSLHERLLGPSKPAVAKIQLYHIREILLKLEIGLSPQKIRKLIKKSEQRMRANPEFKYMRVYYDVDPL